MAESVRIQDKIKSDTIVKIASTPAGLDKPRFMLGYWSIRGLGAPLRMMLSASGVDHWILLYDVTEDGDDGWSKESYFKDKKFLKNNYDTLMNLPFLVDTQGEEYGDKALVLAQTNAIFTYLGRELNMLGSTKLETCRCEELLCEIMDLRNKMTGFAYKPGNRESAMIDGIKLLKSIGVANILDKLELYLRNKYKDDKLYSCNIRYLVGSSLTAPDFHLWEMLDQYDSLYLSVSNHDDGLPFHGPFGPNSRPYLQTFYDNFRAEISENKSYCDCTVISKDLPFNNPYARFGSNPKNDKPWGTDPENDALQYRRGQETPWKGRGVIEEIRNTTSDANNDSNKRQRIGD